MRNIIPLAALGVVLAGPTALASAGAPIHRCDHLATHPSDPDKLLPGIGSKEMDLAAAATACREAVAANPEEPRFHYQLGRALYYGGNAEEGLDALYAAADRGYRQAIFVIGFVYADGGKVPRDICRAGHVWQRSEAAGHPWSKYYLAHHALEGDFGPCRFALSDQDVDKLVAGFKEVQVGPGGQERKDGLLRLHAERRARK